MTMMTPMGQGGRMYPRRRRWPQVIFVSIVVIAVAAGIGYGAWRWLDGRNSPDEPAAEPSPSCSTPSAKPPKDIPPPRQVSIDVFNSTDESGLAINTADDLSTRGFDVQDIGNAPRLMEAGAALVRYHQRDLGAAIRVAAYIPGAELVETKSKRDGPVSLWLGPDFERVLSSGAAKIEAVPLPTSPPVCR